MNKILPFILIILIGCNSNPLCKTVLYKDVVAHYSEEDKNSEKLKATKYLIEHMGNKYSLFDTRIDESLNMVYDSLKTFGMVENGHITIERKQRIELLQSHAPHRHKLNRTKDINCITAADLIRHVDITYAAWLDLSKTSGADFSDYCSYILPYRVRNEKYEPSLVKLLHEGNKEFVDSVKSADSVVQFISQYVKSIDCQMSLSLGHDYPYTFSPLQIDRLRMSPRCDDNVAYLVLLFRSLGIPAACDFLPQWGNHHYSGHSWLSVKWQGTWYAFDAFDGSQLKSMYKYESIPKVYRKSYSVKNLFNSEDVTEEYQDIVDLNVKLMSIEGCDDFFPAIALFNSNMGFKVVDVGKKHWYGGYEFKNLGRRVVYFAGGINNGKFIPMSYPIFIDSCGYRHNMDCNCSKLKKYTFLRKFPLTASRRNREKLDWCRSLSGSRFEGSNNDFKTRDTLLVLSNYNSYKEEIYKINSGKKYKYIRYCCGKNDQIASINYVGKDGIPLKGKIIHKSWGGGNKEALFDNDILTWKWVGNKKYHIYICTEFPEPVDISSISVLARNDGNQIIVGDRYELFYFNKSWQSIGRKKAIRQSITFENVPSNGYYWLRNLSEGTEEIPFMMKKHDVQYWAGE